MPPLWIHLIMQCLKTVSYSVLVNDEPYGKITPRVGLRQGDPLSPYNFILCMETLSRKFVIQQEKGVLRGLKISQREPEISHLLFADDALFSLKGTLQNCWNVNATLREFCSLSGEMINQDKSYAVFSKNTPRKICSSHAKRVESSNKRKAGKIVGSPDGCGWEKSNHILRSPPKG